jgi:hypothetical protein
VEKIGKVKNMDKNTEQQLHEMLESGMKKHEGLHNESLVNVIIEALDEVDYPHLGKQEIMQSIVTNVIDELNQYKLDGGNLIGWASPEFLMKNPVKKAVTEALEKTEKIERQRRLAINARKKLPKHKHKEEITAGMLASYRKAGLEHLLIDQQKREKYQHLFTQGMPPEKELKLLKENGLLLDVPAVKLQKKQEILAMLLEGPEVKEIIKNLGRGALPQNQRPLPPIPTREEKMDKNKGQ